MSNEIKSTIYKDYVITVYEAEQKRNEKFKAKGHPFSSVSLYAAFKLPRFNKYGNDGDKLTEQIKKQIDDLNNKG